MFTTGSKLFLGGTAASVLAAIVWGLSNGGSSGYVGVIGLISAAIAFALLFGVNMFVRDCNVPAADAEAVAQAAAANPPVGASAWPIAAAVGVGALVVGAVTRPLVFKIGIVVLLAAGVEWLVQGWSERASSDPAYNAALRKRILNPLELPILAAIGLAVVIYSFSRIMLFLSSADGPYVFILVGAVIVVVAFTVAARPTLKRGVIVGVCTIGALGLVSTGVVMAVGGQRTINKHPTTADDDAAACLRDHQEVQSNPEFKEIEHRAAQRVAAKSSPTARVVLENGKLTVKIDGAPASTTLTVARSNQVNLLFTNRDAEPSRLTGFAGTAVATVNDTEVKTQRLACTTLVDKNGEQMLTLNFPKSSEAAPADDPYRLMVPGAPDATVRVVVP